MLWLALYFPALPLSVFERAEATEAALAVSDGRMILAANPTAQRAGIACGMPANAARALLSDLHLHRRDPTAEKRLLEHLAAWGLQFTSWVSLLPPQGLLLEVEGSLRLFQGLDTLKSRIHQGLDELGHTAQLGCAPTPDGAWLLGLSGDERPALTLQTLRQRVGSLPMGLLGLSPRELNAFRGLGVHSIDDCLRLPRAGLARRFGPALSARLDRMLGRAPDPRPAYRPPQRFHSRLELPAEVSATEPLLFILRRLLLELGAYLRGLDGGVQRIQIRLEHHDHPATEVAIGLLTPARDPDRLLMLARERLSAVPLPAPVVALSVSTEQILPFTPIEEDLLSQRRGDGSHGHQLLERLSARLGQQAICGLQSVSEHRPERAWRYGHPGATGSREANTQRPLWLLPRPRPLPLRDGTPHWNGRLILQQGPERIETGWWDGEDISRDYYIACNPEGERLWIFRERRGDKCWFLHGLFS